MKSVRLWISRLVRFGKRIPGFKQLLLEDQINLLKCEMLSVIISLLLSSLSFPLHHIKEFKKKENINISVISLSGNFIKMC